MREILFRIGVLIKNILSFNMYHLSDRGYYMGSYCVAVSVGKRRVLEGEALSLAALKKSLDLVDRYAKYTTVIVCISTTISKPRNTIRFNPIEDIKLSDYDQHVSLIPFEVEEDGDGDDDGDDDGDSIDDEDPFPGR